jgi:hypothetical protein
MAKKKAQQGKGSTKVAKERETAKCEEAEEEEEGDEEEGDEISVELELDSEGRISGTRESGIDLSPFRAWHGKFAPNSDVEGLIRADCDKLWGVEDIHGNSFFVPADWDPKKVK